MKKEVVSASNVPALPGVPYSPAIKVSPFVFISGQVPDDTSADMKTQTRQVLQKVKALTEAAGTKIENVVKCTVYITDMKEFGMMNEAYKELFKDKPPARVTVEISGLVKEFKVEIDAIAFIE